MALPSKKMTYVRVGKSGLKVSRIILGCMSYGTPEWQGWVLEEEESIKHIKAAWDAGINTFDTADAYSSGHSELILGKALKQLNVPRASYVVLTKVFFPSFGPDGPIKGVTGNPDEGGLVNRHGLSRKHIFDSIQGSLQRLQLDYVDMLQCHRFDPSTPIEETMKALHDVVQMGWVRYIGMSSCWAWQFQLMQNYAINKDLTPFISMQNHHSLLYREEEREMNPTCNHFGVGTLPWSPLARGHLCRPVAKKTENQEAGTSREQTDPYLSLMRDGAEVASDVIITRVEELAKKKGVTMAQISIAWLLHKEPVTAPIIGTTKLEQLHDIIGAIDVKFTDEELSYLEQPYVPRVIVGH